METHDVTVMKRIGYILFLIVILLYLFCGSGEAEILDAADNARTILAFGKYEQDNNPDNGPEEIEWIVLEEQDGNLLLLSRYGLDAVPFNDGDAETTWEDSSLRGWMNGDFLETAFTSEERSAILVTAVNNGPDQGRKTDLPGGADTMDRVFLLSYREAFAKYLLGNGTRMCAPTSIAAAHGALRWKDYMTDDRPGGTWWLRSPGKAQGKALIVDYDGSLASSNVRLVNHSVRPALWLDPGKEGLTLREVQTPSPEPVTPEI